MEPELSGERTFIRMVGTEREVAELGAGILKPRLHDTFCCQTGCQTGSTTGWTFVTRRSRLFNRLYNRFDSRLYRVNGVLRLV